MQGNELPITGAKTKLPIVQYIILAHQAKVRNITSTEITATGVSHM